MEFLAGDKAGIFVAQKLRELANEKPATRQFEERVEDARRRMLLGEEEEGIRREHGLIVLRTARERNFN